MRFVFFSHSLLSDWNHGNAHFLRGITSELIGRGHRVRVYEPRDSWSRLNLIANHGEEPIHEFSAHYPGLRSYFLEKDTAVEPILEAADVVVVHEWTDPALVQRIAECRRSNSEFKLLFHDTHHRAVSDPGALHPELLEAFDGVLAFGESLRRAYIENGWHSQVWTWHEAADTRVFCPSIGSADRRGVVWIGNWGDGERSAELSEFLFEPVRRLGISAAVYGVRYPVEGLQALNRAGIDYHGWAANFRAPEIYARHLFTLHVPRGPYRDTLRGIPTIRVFEALACGIPLICAPWDDCEGLFTAGKDYLLARNGNEMTEWMNTLAGDPRLRCELSRNGLRTIQARHTCAHRVDELLKIIAQC